MDIRTGSGRQATGSVAPGTASTTTQVQVSTDSAVATAVIIGILFAEGMRYFLQTPDGRRSPISASAAERARLAPPRVGVQDCTRPVDPAAGNLVCR